MTKKYLLVTANFKDWRQEFFIKYMSPRNKEYALIHNFEYIELLDVDINFRDHPSWLSFKLVSNLIKDGTIKEGDIVTKLDADMCVVDMKKEYVTKKSFTYSIDSANTHNMGSYSMKINEWSNELLDNILSESRHKQLLEFESRHDYFGNTDSFVKSFREQASWYFLAGITRHSQKSFFKMPNFGWHSDHTKFTHYSLKDLYKNVEILPTEWNVTLSRGETDCRFLINKTKFKDTIFRHFAGSNQWSPEWFYQYGPPKRLSIINKKNYLKSFFN